MYEVGIQNRCIPKKRPGLVPIFSSNNFQYLLQTSNWGVQFCCTSPFTDTVGLVEMYTETKRANNFTEIFVITCYSLSG